MQNMFIADIEILCMLLIWTYGSIQEKVCSKCIQIYIYTTSYNLDVRGLCFLTDAYLSLSLSSHRLSLDVDFCLMR